MLKAVLKYKTLVITATFMITLTSALILPQSASAESHFRDPPTPTPKANACDPAKDEWCKGKCDTRKQTLSEQQLESCKCDGTPNLNSNQLKACKACKNETDQKDCLKSNPIVTRINDIVKFLSALVGIVIAGTIIVGGIQYATSADRADAVSAAKKRITNGLVALVIFILTFSFLQWLIPGGIFR